MPYKNPRDRPPRPYRYRYRPGNRWAKEWLTRHPGYMNAWHAARRAEQNPEDVAKNAARKRAGTERRAGRLVSVPCEICEAEPVQGHHAFGYAPEMALAVWWLCRKHHMAMHRFIRRP